MSDEDSLKKAMFWEGAGDSVVCGLCPHSCRIAEGATGICGVRKNLSGELFSLNYGRVSALGLDPIEKKPLYHFFPSSFSLSLACPGCNFRCSFCQNWTISQVREGLARTENLSPEDIVALAIKYRAGSISYTYTEPTVFFEFAYDVSRLARERNLANIFITNGFIEFDAIEKIAAYLDAANIDLKAFSETTYRDVCGGKLGPVLEAIKAYYEFGIWIEITTLIIPGLNDSDEELSKIAEFIAGISVDIPWHISAFHPDYRMMDRDATPLQLLLRAEALGRKAGLRYIYPGNVAREANTYCPQCGKLLIRRIGFNVLEDFLSINGGHCPECNFKVEGIWTDSTDSRG